MTHTIKWVLKTSKLCNLRCSYCYEFAELSSKDRVQLTQYEHFFENIARFYASAGVSLNFVWHGGEPLLVPEEYYSEIASLQKKYLLKKSIAYSNSVQTNLTRLNESTLNLLNTFFHRVGVSLDPINSERLRKNGSSSLPAVEKNIRSLHDHGIDFACITVLSRANSNRLIETIEYFDKLAVPFRFLPIYRDSFSGQQDWRALSSDEIVEVFRTAFDYWMKSSSHSLRMDPIEEYIRIVLRHRKGQVSSTTYAQESYFQESAFIVDVNGDTYSVADAYDYPLRHGNIFSETIEYLMSSELHSAVQSRARKRMEATCAKCPFYGPCDGVYMAQATEYQRHMEDGSLRCAVVRPTLEYIESRLDNALA